MGACHDHTQPIKLRGHVEACQCSRTLPYLFLCAETMVVKEGVQWKEEKERQRQAEVWPRLSDARCPSQLHFDAKVGLEILCWSPKFRTANRSSQTPLQWVRSDQETRQWTNNRMVYLRTSRRSCPCSKHFAKSLMNTTTDESEQSKPPAMSRLHQRRCELLA